MSRIEFRPVVKMAAETRATEALRDSVVNGLIAPGSRITEIALAEEMQLSRATIRAALHQLATEGLILLVPYTCWTVASLSAHDVWELYTLRSSLERLGAQLLARQLNATSASAVEDALSNLVKECNKGNRNKIAEADFALHKTIISQVEHGRLNSQYRVIEQQIRMYIRSSDALIQKPSTIVDQHKPIVSAILARNEELAGRLSEEHNLTEGEKLSDYLRKTALVIPSAAKKPGKTKTKKQVGSFSSR